MIICVSSKFDSAHYLPDYDGKCNRIHGHTWHVEFRVMGPPSNHSSNTGMVMDFTEAKKLLNEVIDKLDHQHLNEFVDNPTCESIAMFIAGEMKDKMQGKLPVFRIRVKEGEGGWAQTDWL